MSSAGLKALSTKKKKPEPKPMPQRKSGAAKVLEERHIGVEITSWVNIPNIDHAIYQNLCHYGYFYDHKDAFKWAEVWVKKNRTANELVNFKASEDWRVNTTLGGLCKMQMAGAPLEEKYMARINNGIDAAIEAGRANLIAENLIKAKPVKTAADILKTKINDFISEVEFVIDEYHDERTHVDWENYSVFNELKKINAPKPLAQKVYDYYKPLHDELEELIMKKTPDLVEGYSHLKTMKEKKDYLSMIKNIIDDCSKFMNASTASKVRAVRQPRAKKKIPVSQLVSKVKYQKESVEHKLTSVDPANIIGATEVYLFNTKYRHLIQLVAASVEGFSVKGTTITNLAEGKCFRKTLRKPEETLIEIGKTTKARVSKVFVEIKTKEAAANGRLNEEIIILKVFK